MSVDKVSLPCPLFVNSSRQNFFYTFSIKFNALHTLCHFYRIGNAVFLLKWIKECMKNKEIHINFYYDIACVLDTHLKV